MSNAQDYRTKAAEFAHLASKATSLKDIRELRQQAQAFRSLAENEEWAPADGRMVTEERTIINSPSRDMG